MITLLTALLIGVTNVVNFVPAESLGAATFPNISTSSLIIYEYPICSETSAVYCVTADVIVEDIKRAGMTEEVVKKLAAGGHICAVLGHRWRGGRPGETETRDWNGNVIAISQYLDYHPGISYRTCQICGKHESKTEGEWK